MNTRTLLCLDVDGVVASLADPSPGDHRRVVQVENAVGTFTVRYDPRVVDGLNALTREGVVQLHWVTTWGRAARDALAPALGIDPGSQVSPDPSDPGHARHPYDPARPWWKLSMVLQALRDNPNRPVAWCEDDLDDLTRARFPGLHSGPSLLITPDPGVGLSLDELARVAAFARQHAAS